MKLMPLLLKLTWPLELLIGSTPIGTFVQIDEIHGRWHFVASVFDLQAATFVHFNLSGLLVLLTQVIAYRVEREKERENTIINDT